MNRKKRLQKRIIILLAVDIFLIGCLFVQKGTLVSQSAQITEKEKEAKETDAAGKKVALTFDDGPSPVWTKKLLEGLKQRNVKATFFVTGANVEAYPELVKKMKEDGHLIGNHSYSHIQLTAVHHDKAIEEINKTNEAIYNCIGEYPEFIRPPFGSMTKAMEKEVDMMLVLWNIDPLDWCKSSASRITRSVVKDVEDHGIILLHDQYESSVQAALQIIDTLQAQGYEFVTVDEILLE